MSAAEKLVQFDAMQGMRTTRGLGSLADCPLARAYEWEPPVEDFSLRVVRSPPHRLHAVLAIKPPQRNYSPRMTVEKIARFLDDYRTIKAQGTVRGDMKALFARHGIGYTNGYVVLHRHGAR
jgi:hypothetical protein